MLRQIVIKLISFTLLLGACKDAPKASELGERSDYVPPDTTIESPPNMVEIFPAEIKLAEGETANYYVAATYPDGTRKSITADIEASFSEDGIVTFDATTLTAVALKSGETRLTVMYQGLTATAQLVVTKAILYNIEATAGSGPFHVGQVLQLAAKGIYSNHKSADISELIRWAMDENPVAEFNKVGGRNGQIKLLTPGLVTLKGSLEGVTQELQITVDAAQLEELVMAEPVLSLPIGVEKDLLIEARHTDNSLVDIKTQASWSVVDTTVATVGVRNGLSYVKTLKEGMTAISGSYNGKTIAGYVIGLPATLCAISLNPPNATVALGNSARLIAMGTYSNGNQYDVTSIASWTSSVPGVAGVGNGGLDGGKITSFLVGDTVITAAISGMAQTANVSIGPAEIVEISATPSPIALVKGLTTNLMVMATFSNGATSDITTSSTYKSSANAIATVSNDPGTEGQVRGANTGTTKITATYGSFSVMVNVTVTAAQLLSLTISPPNPSVALGRTQQFVGTGAYTDGSQKDLTQQLLWSADYSTEGYTDVAWMATSAGTRGIAHTTGLGVIKIIAEMNGITTSTNLTVTPKEVIDVTISPASGLSLDVGALQQFTATAIYTNGSTMDVTDPSGGGYTTTWNVNDNTLLNLNFAGVAHAKALSEGLVIITLTAVTPDGTFNRVSNLSVQTPCLTGTRFGYYCWYGGNLGASCDDTCASFGASYHDATQTSAGSSSYTCLDVIQAVFSPSFTVLNSDGATNPDGLGLGCSVFGGFTARYTTPVTNSAASHPNFKRVCACTQ